MDLSVSLPAALFICFMVFLSGFVDSVAGGGGLISLPAYLLSGLPIHFAYGCNKFSAACGTTFSTLRFMISGAIDWPVALLAAAGSFIGSYICTHLILLIDGSVLKIIFTCALPFIAVFVLAKHNYGKENYSSELPRSRALVMALLIGLLIGGYDGFIGPGTGTIGILIFSLLMRYDLRTASGNTKLLNLASNYASFITFATAGTIYYPLAVPAAACGILGNLLGSGMALKRGAKFIKPMMIVVFCLLLIKMLYDLLT